jgi:DNA uptake protein ComE-like DNA-binding protein
MEINHYISCGTMRIRGERMAEVGSKGSVGMGGVAGTEEQITKINLNTASREQLQFIFPQGQNRTQEIITNRPYSDWADVKRKNAKLSDNLLEEMRRAGATIGND